MTLIIFYLGNKRFADEISDHASVKTSNPRKRRYFGEDSENKLAMIFKTKARSKKMKSKMSDSEDEEIPIKNSESIEKSLKESTPVKKYIEEFKVIMKRLILILGKGI